MSWYPLAGQPSSAWVKRVVGLPGDRIEMRQGQLFINDHAAEMKPDGIGQAEDDNGGVEPAYRYVETLPNGVRHEILKLRDDPARQHARSRGAAGASFVMGDNRDNSADSRVPVRDGGVGMLPMDDLVGRADAGVGSWDLGMRHQPVYTGCPIPPGAVFYLGALRALHPGVVSGLVSSLRAQRSKPAFLLAALWIASLRSQ